MNKIMLLKVNDQEYVHVLSEAVTLDNITCCDKVSLIFEVGDKKIVIKEDIEVKQLGDLKKGLELMVSGQAPMYVFLAEEDADGFDDCCDSDDESDDQEFEEEDDFESFSLSFLADKCNNFSMDISSFVERFYNKTIPVETLQSWIAQLELLQVLTEENEKEKQARGKGCC